MKRLAVLMLFLAGPAWAQAPTQSTPRPPEVIESTNRIDIGGVGESTTLKFEYPFKSFDSVPKDVVNILPRSDRQMTITGTNSGQALVFIYDDQDRVIYTATVSVQPGPGHLVKVYSRRVKDFAGFYCSDTGCGRADLDKKLTNGGRDPDDPASTIVQTPLPGGGFVQRQYN